MTNEIDLDALSAIERQRDLIAMLAETLLDDRSSDGLLLLQRACEHTAAQMPQRFSSILEQIVGVKSAAEKLWGPGPDQSERAGSLLTALSLLDRSIAFERRKLAKERGTP